MNPIRTRLAQLTLALTIPATSHAANLAFDDATSSAYNAGWEDGSNGGNGWGPWSLTTEGIDAGFFISSSITNGNGADDGYIGGVAGDRDIDTTDGLVTPISFGMFAGTFNLARATRSFTGGPLAVGQTFMIDFDNGFVNLGGSFGIDLLNSGGDTLWQLQYAFGDDFYGYSRGSEPELSATDVSPGTEGLRLAFELRGEGFYSMSLERRDGVTFDSGPGFLNFNDDAEITQVRIFADGVGSFDTSDLSSDFFINSMTVVPEPSTSLLGALAGIGLLLRRKRA
jgi:hypothetical protein